MAAKEKLTMKENEMPKVSGATCPFPVGNKRGTDENMPASSIPNPTSYPSQSKQKAKKRKEDKGEEGKEGIKGGR